MSGITPEQERQQQAAAFGLPQMPSQPVDLNNLTHEQRELLRGILFQHDAQNAAMAREFDLNKPPTPPYRYQEFPRMVYREGKTAVVQNNGQLQEMLAMGWRIEPQGPIEQNLGGELPASMMAEIAAIDAEARKPSQSQLQKEIEALRAENEALKAKRK